MIAQLGYGTSTVRRFWGCDETDTGGTLGVVVNGTYHEGPTLEAATDYTGTIDVSISGDFTWYLTIDTVQATPTRTAKAIPSSGEYLKAVIWGDCTDPNANGWQKMKDEDAHFGICQGDWDYADSNAGFTRDTDPASYRVWHRESLTKGLQPNQKQQFLANQANIGVHDSHEGILSITYAVGTDEYNAAYQAIREYITWMNPENTDSGIHVAPDPVPYFRHTISDVEFIFAEQISWMTGASESLGSTIDATQLAWLTGAIASSTATVICVMTPHQPQYVDPVNVIWDDIFRAIDSVNKTVILFTADSHGAYACWRPVGTTMSGGTITDVFANYGLLEVQGTPLSHPLGGTGDAITSGQSTIYLNDDSDNPLNIYDCNYNYTTLEYHPDGSYHSAAPNIEIRIKNAWNGATRWHGVIEVGSREPITLQPAKQSGFPR